MLGGVLVVLLTKCLGAPDPNGPCSLLWRRRYVMLPGKECRSPASMTLHKVDIAGENRVAWENGIRAVRCGSEHKAVNAWDGA